MHPQEFLALVLHLLKPPKVGSFSFSQAGSCRRAGTHGSPVPLTNLFLGMADKMGVEDIKSHDDSTARLTGIG